MNELNEMETMPIKKLAFKISIPMVLSMISIALYSIVDSMFISKISDNTLEVVALSVPIQSIIVAIGLGTGIGVNTILARTLGEKNELKAKKIINNSFILIFLSYIIIVLINVFGLKKYFQFFTNDEKIQNLGFTYLSIINMFSIGNLYQLLFEKILESYGKTKSSMIVQFSGAIINLILDPILIFGYLGITPMGIKGAAIATVIGQSTGMFIGLFIILKNKLIQIKDLIQIKLDKNIIKDIYKVGVPTIILESVTSFITLILNKLLGGISEDAISVWGLYCQLQKFVIIIVYGFNYGMIPIVAYNIGAKKQDRVKESIQVFLIISIFVTFIGQIIFLFFTNQLINIYNVSNNVLEMGMTAFRILSCGFIFAGISLVFSALFQSFGKATYSLIVNMSRQLFFSIPLAILLVNFLGIYGIWISFVIAEFITMIIAIFLYKTQKEI